MTDITIVATTWLPPGKEIERASIFQDAARSWQDNLEFKGKIHLHISDDGSEEGDGMTIVRAIGSSWRLGEVSSSKQKRHGVGASLNVGLKHAFTYSPVVLHAVDDWQLLSKFDLNPWVDFIENSDYLPNIVRFFPHPDLIGEIKFIPPYGWAARLDFHHFIFSFRPALWHKRLFDELGYFKEKSSALEVEYLYNENMIRNQKRVWLALPEVWKHIGENMSLSGIAV